MLTGSSMPKKCLEDICIKKCCWTLICYKIPEKGILEMLLNSYLYDTSITILRTTESEDSVQRIPRRCNLYKPPDSVQRNPRRCNLYKAPYVIISTLNTLKEAILFRLGCHLNEIANPSTNLTGPGTH